MSAISRDGLHALLWHRASRGTLKVDQTALANDLSASKYIINRVLRTMCDEGRIRQLPGTAGPHSRTYEVIDPKVWPQPEA